MAEDSMSRDVTMNPSTAIRAAALLNAFAKTAPSDLTDATGAMLTVGADGYSVVTTIYANDLATDINPNRAQDTVSIGLICQAVDSGDVVIAIRGTEGILEWIHDAEFLQVACPFLAGAGRTEDGFTAMYESLRTGTAANSPTLVNALSALRFPHPVASVTICGHSLGGALATLLALDLAVNTVWCTPSVYTFGSPRVGDALFASTFNQVVTRSHRIANRLDIVAALPPPVDYAHVLAPYELNPIRLLPLPPQVLVKFDLECEHALNTYLNLLSMRSGGVVIPLEAGCRPTHLL